MTREKHPNSPAHHKCRKLETLEDDEIFSLPEEIITEILSRLPVKSIVKFRCVSKSWLSLIFSKRFIKNHLKFSTEDSNANGYRLILTIYPHYGLKQCSVRSLMSEEALTDAFDIDYPMKDSSMMVSIVGCCNGLICIAINNKDLFIWNPAIKESTKLPSVNMTMRRHNCTIHGFGFDESNDDYKVVKILRSFGGESITSIYSLKTDSWKRVEDFKGKEPMNYPGMFANGKLHWLARNRVGSTLKKDIVSFDLETQLYETVDQPNYVEGEFDTTLGVLGGCICALCNYGTTQVDVWVLKEYGVKGSWCKVLSSHGDLSPSCMLPSGDIIFMYGTSFLVYNPRCKSYRFIEAMNYTNNRFLILEADGYVESLVSPVANGRLKCRATPAMKK